jgi:hypothetical protein
MIVQLSLPINGVEQNSTTTKPIKNVIEIIPTMTMDGCDYMGIVTLAEKYSHHQQRYNNNSSINIFQPILRMTKSMLVSSFTIYGILQLIPFFHLWNCCRNYNNNNTSIITKSSLLSTICNPEKEFLIYPQECELLAYGLDQVCLLDSYKTIANQQTRLWVLQIKQIFVRASKGYGLFTIILSRDDDDCQE